MTEDIIDEDQPNLEEKLKEKLEKGEIDEDEYNQLMEKFRNLDLLGTKVSDTPPRRKKRPVFLGRSTIDGGEYSEPVKVSGKLVSNGDLKCTDLKVSGSATVNGDLTVVSAAKISGALDVSGEGKIGGTFKLSGKGYFGENAYLTNTSKISGKLQSGRDIIAGDDMKISGKLLANNLRSTALVKVAGKVLLSNDLIAEEFVTSGGGSRVDGSINATTVEIARKYRENYKIEEEPEFDDTEDINDLPGLAKYVTGVVTRVIPKAISASMRGFGGGPPSIFVVGRNIEGNLVDISHTHVKGDVIADVVKIGPGVIVDGTIYYNESIIVPEGTDYDIKQQSSKE